jgi:Zn-dependent M28 family amino/carboxypeptidase
VPRMTARAAATGIALLLATTACQPVPSTAPTGAPAAPSAAATAAVSPVASPAPASAGPASSLADELRDAISVEDIVADLGRLDAIATASNGHRASGSPGHEASAELVADELRAAGYEVSLEPVQVTAFSQDAPSVIDIQGDGGPELQDVRDFKAMLLSPSGEATAPLFALGFDPAAKPGDRNGLGCNPADWSAVPSGVIALVQPGSCRRRDVLLHAQAAGVAAVITSYADWSPGSVLRPTLIEAGGLTIPAIGTTGATGLALLAASQAGRQVHVETHTTVATVQTPNVIAETAGGDPAHVVMIGGHLDSVIDGPGINDNGTGTMSILEIARELAKLEPQGAPWKVRFAFWTGEEIGLLGSFAYVQRLAPEEAATIEAYLNFDMIGSPNAVHEIYDPSGTSRPAAGGTLQALLAQALTELDLASEVVDIGGASDHLPFDRVAGIPVGGLFSGASELKTEEEAALFGGTAGAPTDPCYHLACDAAANIDHEALKGLAKAAAWALGRLASGEVALPEG